jgi:predicted metal-dependent peptidase
VADDYYLPSLISETVGEVILSIDTSGSISNDDIGRIAAHIQELCETVTPERIRVLWWDTQVHGEQVFEGDYTNLKGLLKPMGGGGTRVGCVSDYVVSKGLSADCMIVFTDGYVEDDINWQTPIPTLWLVKGNNNFKPPSGGLINVEDRA